MMAWYFSGGYVLRAPEHHVLEEVGEARLAGLDLVARAGLHRDLERHEVREAGRHDDDLQAVGQSFLDGVKRQDVARPGAFSRAGFFAAVFWARAVTATRPSRATASVRDREMGTFFIRESGL